MKIVIEIPDDEYLVIRQYQDIAPNKTHSLAMSILNGTPVLSAIMHEPEWWDIQADQAVEQAKCNCAPLKWIAVTERLPEDHDWYLVVVKEKSTGYQYIPRVANYLHDNCWELIDTEDANTEWLDDLECIAWMPLPKPYEADKE